MYRLPAVALLIGALLVVSGVRADEEVHDPDVLKLTKDNFDTVVNREDLILVEFYAPWCGHCKHLAPEYAKAATALKKNDPPVSLAKVDATQESDLASRFNVNGYPTLKIFRNGKQSEYKGPREADGIVAYMQKQVGPAAKPVTTQRELDHFINAKGGSDTYWVAGFFKSGTPSALQSSFVLTANKMRDDHTFLKITSDELRKAYNVDNEALIIFKTFDDKQTLYTGDTKPANVEKWVLRNSLPLVGFFDSKTRNRYVKRGLPIGKVYVDVQLTESNEKHTKYFVNRLKPLVEEFRDDIVFALANTKDQMSELSEVNAQKVTNPFVIENPQDGKKYVHTDKFTTDNIRSFLSNFKAGKVDAHVKSEEEPAKNDGPVKIVTGRNFKRIVQDDEKDVLIEFYAPWCGHCKQLAPIYEELGQKFKNYDSVVIAKIDATANDYPSDQYAVSGYPSIFFKPAKAGAKPIKYDGERDLASLQAFVKKNAVKPLKKAKKNKKAAEA